METWETILAAVAISWAAPIILGIIVLLYRAATWHRR